MRAYAEARHEDWAYTQAYFPHKQPAPLKQRPAGGSISIDFINPLYPQPDPDYNVQYRFDRKSDTYLRFMGGAPHIDTATGRTLQPANVVVMQTQAAIADVAAGPTPQSILIPTIGRGKAYFFRDGTVIRGTWQQPNQFAPLRFFDRRGHPITLNPGQTWIEVVPKASTATWSLH